MKHLAVTLGALALASGLCASGPSHAADIARPVYKAAPAPVHQTYWTGCYFGGNIGYGWAPTNWSTPGGVELASHSAGGVIGGGQIGCDYEMNRLVVGIQGMFNASAMKSDSNNLVNPALLDQTRTPWMASLTGRIGITGSPILFYAKGGAAWVRSDYQECCVPLVAAPPPPPPPPPPPIPDGVSKSTRVGWTVGGGVEYIFIPNWSVFAEYNYVRLNGSVDFTGINGWGNFAYNIDQDLHAVLLGINYRF
jgi:outer membrane immunogenic protein